jgi:hypothetical protein
MTKYYTCHGVHFLIKDHQFVDLHNVYLWYSKDSLLADLQQNGFTIDQSDSVVEMPQVQGEESQKNIVPTNHECIVTTVPNYFMEIAWKINIYGVEYIRKTGISLQKNPLKMEKGKSNTHIDIPTTYGINLVTLHWLLTTYLGSLDNVLKSIDDGSGRVTNTNIYQQMTTINVGKDDRLTTALFINTYDMIYWSMKDPTEQDCINIFENIIFGFEKNLVNIAPFIFKTRRPFELAELQNYSIKKDEFKYIGGFIKTIDDVKYLIFASWNTRSESLVFYRLDTPQQFNLMVKPTVDSQEQLNIRLEKYQQLIKQKKVNLWVKNEKIRLYIRLESLLPNFNDFSNNKKHKYTSSNPYIDLSQAEDELVTPMGSKDIRSEIEQEIRKNIV